MRMMDLIEKRFSVRAYKPDPVEDEKLQYVLAAARLAPTAANRQPFWFIVVHTKRKKTKLRQVYDRIWFVQAPLVICACGIPSQAWVRRDGKNYCDVDVAIAMDHLVLAATEQGLGTCWIAAFDAAAARKLLLLPDGVEPVAFTPLGYPDDAGRPRKRKPVAEIVKYEHW